MGLFKKQKQTVEKFEESSVKKRSKFTLFDTLNFYTKLWAEWAEHDDLPDKSLETGRFYYTPESIVTSNGIKKMYFIEEFPLEMPRYFLSDLRDDIASTTYTFNMTNKSDTKVSVNIIQNADFFDLDFSNYKIRGVWASFTRQYEKVKKELDETMDLKNALKTDKYSEQVVKKVNSFLHIKEAKENKSSFYKTKVAIEIVCLDDNLGLANDALKDAEKTLKGFLITNDIRAKRTFLDAHNYQRNFTPAGSETKSLIRKKYRGDVWSDDTLSSFVVPEHGVIGDDDGIPFGVDLINGETISFNLKKGTDSKNVLVTASSGEGKSYFVKMLVTFMLGDKESDVVIFDYEGSDYANLGIIADAKSISMGGVYVNTMVIADPIGVEEIDKEAKQLAIDTTTTIFDVLTDPENGMNTRQKAIFSDMMAHAYSQSGVGMERDTWGLSKNLNFFKLYSVLVNDFILGNDPTPIENHTLQELKDFRNVLKPYFEEGGIYSNWFREPLSFNDFLDSSAVIFNFGMGGKAEILRDKRQIILSQLYASHLTSLKAAYNRSKGKFTNIIIEELNRYLEQPFSSSIIKAFATGGRKLGLITFLITNDPSTLVSGSDIESPLLQENLSAIMTQINTICLGAMPERDMQNLMDIFNLWKSEAFLMQLANVHEQGIQQGGYKYAFYVKKNGEATVLQAISNSELENLDLYETDINVANPELRSSVVHNKENLISGLSSVFELDGKWDEQGKTYTDVTGKEIKKVL